LSVVRLNWGRFKNKLAITGESFSFKWLKYTRTAKKLRLTFSIN